MKLTCVTATFNVIKSGNREKLIRCIKSVAALKTEHEHLIYDGASTDGTVELLRELESKTPGLKVVSEPDTGIYNALNKGVRDARGEWFYVLGADDYICHPEVMDGLCESFGADDAIVAPVERERGVPLFRSDKDLRVLLWFVAYSHQGLIMKTKTIRRCRGFDETYRICADWDLMRKAHDDCFSFRYTYHAFANYGVGGASESGDGVGDRELYAVSQKHLRLDDQQMVRFWKTKILPWKKIFYYLKHPDHGYRLSAKGMLRRKLISMARMPFYPLVILTRPIRHRIRHRVKWL